MIKSVLFIFILILAWYGNRQYQHKKFMQEAKSLHAVTLSQQDVEPTKEQVTIKAPVIQPKPKPSKQLPKYRCDGRQHCSQMRSYAEAKFFLDHCPNTKMDGDGDGIPCERQFKRY